MPNAPASTDWTLNSAETGLQKGMHVRRPGLNESLEVLRVHNGQAKLKLPDGKTTTISSALPVEWRWPGNDGESKPIAKAITQPTSESAPFNDPDDDSDDEPAPGWITDWSVLAPGQVIAILGETANFNVLRKTDSSARVKNNDTAAISSISVGHKFRILSGEKAAETTPPKGLQEAEQVEKEVRKPRKTRSDKGTKVDQSIAAATLFDTGTDDRDLQPDSDLEDLDNDIPADIQADIDRELNGGDDNDDENEDAGGEDDETEEQEEEEEEADESSNDPEDDDEPAVNEEITLPTNRSSKNTVRPSADPNWITVAQLSEATTHGIPKINTLRKQGKLAKTTYKQDPEDSRRMLYHIDLIDKLKAMPKGTRGGNRRGAKPATDRADRKPRSKKAVQIASKWEKVNGGTHDTGGANDTHALKPRASATVTTFTGGMGSTLDAQLAAAIELANAQIAGLQQLVENLEAQREQLKLWS